jgi:Uncharacterized protein conserved in bacteria
MRPASLFRSLVLTMALPMIFATTLPLSGQAQPAIEEVLVTGEHPGPGLWKVSDGEHVLWILGTQSPVPTRLTWQADDVELVMTEAQQVIGDYSGAFTLQGQSAYTAKGRPLRRLLPSRSYAKWQALKKKYLGDDKQIETALPVTAALLLRSAAFEKTGLTNPDRMLRKIYSLARSYNVPVTTSHQVNKVIDSSDRDAARSERIGIDYLVSTIDTLENDLRSARLRANAWATGDIAALKAQADADKSNADLYASSWPFLHADELRAITDETNRRWIEAASTALRKNQTTFAALPIFLLLRDDGLMPALRAQGFTVEPPVY